MAERLVRNFRLSQELLNAAMEQARREDRSFGNLVRVALREYLRRKQGAGSDR